jgi:hypothetical protein
MLFFGGSWLHFFVALGISIVGKSLLRGFEASKARVAYEAGLVERGVPPQEAGRAWMKATMGGPDLPRELRSDDDAGEAPR